MKAREAAAMPLTRIDMEQAVRRQRRKQRGIEIHWAKHYSRVVSNDRPDVLCERVMDVSNDRRLTQSI